MKTQFDTEIEAKEALALEIAKSEKVNLGYCPLIIDYCVKECVCYYKGDIHQSNPVTQPKCWFVHYPCCTNVLIIGEISTNYG